MFVATGIWADETMICWITTSVDVNETLGTAVVNQNDTVTEAVTLVASGRLIIVVASSVDSTDRPNVRRAAFLS